MRFPPQFLDELRARLPVSEVVGKRVKLRKAGREWKGLSPFNKEKTPSFFVNDGKAMWFDFSSGKSGNIFDFVMQTEGVSFPEAVERLAGQAGIPMPVMSREAQAHEERRKTLHDVIELAAKFFEANLASRAGARGRGYLADRGIASATQLKFRLGYASAEQYALKEHLGAQKISVDDMVEAGLLVAGEEIAVPYDRFRDRVFPCGEVALAAGSTTGPCPNGIAGNGPSAAGAYNTSKNGGAIGASARWTFLKGLTFGVKGFGGSGVGRYGPAGLPDMSIYASGAPHLEKNLLGLSTLEWNGKKLTFFSYVGAEYASRAADYDPISNAYVGYGSPYANNSGCYSEVSPNNNNGFLPASLSHCTADSRVVIEGTGGFWYRFYSGPRGKFQFGTQYSYVTRNTWSGANGIEPHGIDGMIFTSFRYYLP